ncbi:hypothetical protein EV44_g0490 [Erysiphe necator]|uniref:C3H1-type domain-containing protein n=1 Tax=Uncinula necator TaxID=52586 RepID=A0A0B1PG22_UNCNE|nr:hypothetical protein EV44_g0490 [Erysiphe necator]
MAISAFLLAILEQAKEPLHCLHGAGYFTPEEWVQLDLIMNKKYTWTTGTPENIIRHSINRVSHSEHKGSSIFGNSCKNATSLDTTSLCDSSELRLSDIKIPPRSGDVPWKLPTEAMSGKPFDHLLASKGDLSSDYIREQRRISGYSSILGEEYRVISVPLKEKISDYPFSALSSDSKSPLSSSAQKMKSISAWTSEVQNNTREMSDSLSNTHTLSTSSHLNKKSSLSPRSSLTGNQLKELQSNLNSFETNSSAECEKLDKSGPKNKKEQLTLVDKNHGKNPNLIVQEGQTKKNRQQASSRVITGGSKRELDVPLLVQHKESKDRKTAKDSDKKPTHKTHVCWFWAESPGGCRYKPKECINLHVTPTSNTIRNPLDNSKSSRNSGNDNNVEKPLTCWSWASTGSCEEGDKCKDVHGWVIGGVAPGPKKQPNSRKTLNKAFMEQRKKKAAAAANSTTPSVRATTTANSTTPSVRATARAKAAAKKNPPIKETNEMELVDLRINEHEIDNQNLSHSSILMSLDPAINSASINS